MTDITSRKVVWSAANRADQLPPVQRFLTGTTGREPIPLNEGDAQAIAIGLLLDGSVAAFAVTTDTSCRAVRAILARSRDLGHAVTSHYLVDEDLLPLLLRRLDSDVGISLGRTDTDAAIDALLADAIDRGATDVHFDGGLNTSEVRLRIDGELDAVPFRTLSLTDHATFARALYLAAHKAETNWNEDLLLGCSMPRRVGAREYQLRYSQRGAPHQRFDWSLRILPIGQENAIRSFAELGFAPWQVRVIDTALREPSGMILLNGKMNSGKTTTLAAMLAHLLEAHRGRIRIQTIEDPVEYIISRVRHCSLSARGVGAREDAGMSKEQVWAQTLAHFMRSDADVMMLGEIRDPETVAHAQEFCLTGHKLLSTIHANTPIDVFKRLLQHNAAPDVLFGERFVNLLMRLQLVPVLCPDCCLPFHTHRSRVPLHVQEGLRAAAPEPFDEHLLSVRLRGDGCAACNYRGVRGRTTTAALLVPDTEFNRLMQERRYTDAEVAWAEARIATPAGVPYTSLLMHAMSKVFDGIVCPLDVDRLVAPLTRAAHRLPSELRGELTVAAIDNVGGRLHA
jgi:general secretion pathway protein E